MEKKYFIIIAIIIVALAVIDISVRVFLNVPAQNAAVVLTNEVVNNNTGRENTAIISAKFICPGGKTISADFETAPTDQVSLSLSDGRSFVLPHALSADGARYANADESLVFWNKGNTAFIEEQGIKTYMACVTK